MKRCGLQIWYIQYCRCLRVSSNLILSKVLQCDIIPHWPSIWEKTDQTYVSLIYLLVIFTSITFLFENGRPKHSSTLLLWWWHMSNMLSGEILTICYARDIRDICYGHACSKDGSMSTKLQISLPSPSRQPCSIDRFPFCNWSFLLLSHKKDILILSLATYFLRS